MSDKANYPVRIALILAIVLAIIFSYGISLGGFEPIPYLGEPVV